MFVITSCKDKSLFISKSQVEKNEFVKLKIDSILKQKNIPKIISEYIELSKVESQVTIDSFGEIDKTFRIGNLITKEENQEAELTLLEFCQYDYLNPTISNKKIIGFIPVLLFDKYGNIISLKAILKFNDNTSDTIQELQFGLLSLVNDNRVGKLIQSKEIRRNEYLKNKYKIDLKTQQKIQEAVTEETTLKRNKQRKEDAYMQSEKNEEVNKENLYVIKENTFGSTTKDDLDKVYDYNSNGEENLIQDMIASGPIYYLEKGTSCYLSNVGLILSKIRIPNTEIELFVSSDLINKQ